MTLKLDYQQEIQRTFYKISPLSSGTRESQTTLTPFPHFSIVTYIDDDYYQKQFQEAMDIIKLITTHRFCKTLNLHCTLLSTEVKINSSILKSLCDVTKEFFARVNIEQQLNIEFNLIHPGKWDNNHPTESDGRVIALAKKEGINNNFFIDIINKLRDHINDALNLSLERKYRNTIWCTLGFFDEDDFPIDSYIFAAFNHPKLRKFNHTITIKEVAITEFRLKSLNDSIKRYVIKL